jgi:methyl coenzyme M reductase beta subunit
MTNTPIPFKAQITLQEHIDLCDAYDKLLEENAELRKLIPSEIEKIEDIKKYVRDINDRRRSSRPPI